MYLSKKWLKCIFTVSSTWNRLITNWTIKYPLFYTISIVFSNGILINAGFVSKLVIYCTESKDVSSSANKVEFL